MNHYEKEVFKTAIANAYDWQIDGVTLYIDHEKGLITIQPRDPIITGTAALSPQPRPKPAASTDATPANPTPQEEEREQ